MPATQNHSLTGHPKGQPALPAVPHINTSAVPVSRTSAPASPQHLEKSENVFPNRSQQTTHDPTLNAERTLCPTKTTTSSWPT